MAPRRTPKPADATPDQLEQKIVALREQVGSVAAERDALAAKLRELEAAPKAPPTPAERQPFVTRKQPVNGFIVSITGAKRFEDEIWIEAVGDTVVILTGKKARARWNGDESVVVRAAAALPVAYAQPAPASGESQLFGFAGDTNPIGLGALNPRMTPEDAAAAMQSGDMSSITKTLEGLAASIASGDMSVIPG